MTASPNKICSVCRSANDKAAILCVNCMSDLTYIAITIDRPQAAPEREMIVCENGHPLEPGDELCLECGAGPTVQGTVDDSTGSSPGPNRVQSVDGVVLGTKFCESPEGTETFWSGDEALRIVIYPSGIEPDRSRTERLRNLDHPAFPALTNAGRDADSGRYFEVWNREIPSASPLAVPESARTTAIGVANALLSLHEAGLLYRSLDWEKLYLNEGDEIRFTDLDQCISADFGVGHRRSESFSNRYLAPEAAIGSYEEASDWWSLGALLLQCSTRGSGIPEISDQAFMLQLVTRGLPIPGDIPQQWQHLLKGLLTRDPAKRWRGGELLRCLEGELGIPVFYENEAAGSHQKEALNLGDEGSHTPEQWAMLAAQPQHWEQASGQLKRGVLSSWLGKTKAAPDLLEVIDYLQEGAECELDDDERLAVALVSLNDSLPLTWKGSIVNPGWLLGNAQTALGWMSGHLVSELQKGGKIEWLTQLKRRSERAESIYKDLGIAVDEQAFRAASLVASEGVLHQHWRRRRREFPLSKFRGLAVLAEKPAPLGEDLLILLSATLDQFTPADSLLDDAGEEARRGGVDFAIEEARERLQESRREMLLSLNGRIANFSRCGIERLDEWADTFRFERQISLPRLLVLLQVPESQWKTPPHQDYLRSLFEFFHNRILRGIQRGALLNLRVSVNSRNIDMGEIGGPAQPSESILNHILRREKIYMALDPTVFINQLIIERRIRRLSRVAADYFRDTGIQSLYLGYPLLVTRPAASSVTAKPKRAPLFLWPVKIHTPMGSRARVQVAFDRDRQGEFESAGVELNPALVPLLKNEEVDALRQGLAEVLSRTSIDHGALYEICGEALQNTTLAGAEVTRLPQETPEVGHGEGRLLSAGAFFICDFSQQTISQDIRQLQGRPLEDGALARLLRLNPGQAPVELARVPESEKFLVLPADPSQQRAVFRARESDGLVVQGPPGTGKSQTIVNILADCIGRNEKALVVCQKHAALEVVARRMSEEGLGDRFFMVEDARRSRQPIIRALRTQVEAQADWRKPISDQSRRDLAESMERLEKELSTNATATQSPAARSGLKYTEVLDKLIERQGRKSVDAYYLRDLFLPLTWVRIEALVARVSPLISLWVESKYEKSPWQHCEDFSPDAATLKAFRKDLDLWAEAEDERNGILKESGRIFQIADAEAFREWEAGHGPWLRSLGEKAVADADRWKLLWHSETEFPGRLAELQCDARDLKKLNCYADFGQVLIEMDQATFTAFFKADQTLRKGDGKLIARLNPFYWVHKRQIAKFVERLGLPGQAAGFSNQIAWENRRRNLVRRLKQFESEFQLALSLERSDPLAIAARAEELEQRWKALAGISRASSECPVSGEFKHAFSARTTKGIARFLSDAAASLRYEKRQAVSLEKLKNLARWMDADFVRLREQEIRGQKVSNEVVDLVREEQKRIEPALEFRAKFRALDTDEKAVFQKLESSDCRSDLEAVAPPELESVFRTTLENEALLSWKSDSEQKEPALALDPDDFARKVTSLGDTANQLLEANKSRLQRPWRPDLIANATRWMEILRLRGPSSKSIREVLDAGWDYGLFDLRPVWLASPETVSRIFPLREGLFDVVIFDEASQIPVEMAIPTLYRGKRAVICGDRKQLPPTNFFKSDLDDEEDDDALIESMDGDAREEHLRKLQSKREVKDCDDLLLLADGELPDCLLSIHYRSRWRHLIGFSNSAFYDGKLSVPVHQPEESVREHQPIEVRHVGGIYQDQTNPEEADAIILYLDELWKADHPPSVGIVTFNLKQAELIEDRLETRMEEDAEFCKLYQREQDRGGLESIFVRNLENVQGDERDIIIFSTTFGYNQKGKFLRNFGPAGQKGGQRRLNVAVTRSRIKMVIFTSMPLADIAPSLPGHGSTPREILKAYLCYGDAVSRGEFGEADAILHRLEGESRGGYDPSLFAATKRSAFVTVVADFLEAAGYEPRFEASRDAFQFDIALPDPASGLFGLAIECDPPQHPELDSATAREIWRPAVMKRTIPRIVRISSRAWYENPEAEQERLLSACQFAKPKKRKKRKSK